MDRQKCPPGSVRKLELLAAAARWVDLARATVALARDSGLSDAADVVEARLTRLEAEFAWGDLSVEDLLQLFEEVGAVGAGVGGNVRAGRVPPPAAEGRHGSDAGEPPQRDTSPLPLTTSQASGSDRPGVWVDAPGGAWLSVGGQAVAEVFYADDPATRRGGSWAFRAAWADERVELGGFWTAAAARNGASTWLHSAGLR